MGSKIYIFGGRTGIDMGEGCLADLYAFDTATNSWSKLEPKGEGAAWPPKRSYHASAAQVGIWSTAGWLMCWAYSVT